jgi:hypothetical protein
MNVTDTIYAVATRATRLGWLEDEEGNGYHLEDNIADLVEVRGTLDEVARAIVAAVAPLGRLEWSAARAGYLTAHAGGDDWVTVKVFLSMSDDDFPTIAEMDAPALHVAAVLAA